VEPTGPAQPHHRYVFDYEKRTFVGRFEEKYLLVSLWLPPDPIGFVKSHSKRMGALQHYDVERKVMIDDETILVMARGR
jgi:hypothetical protein